MTPGRFLSCAALLVSLAACDVPGWGEEDVGAEVAGFCRPSSTALAEPLDPASPRDATVAARFGEVCELSRMKGLRFFVADAEVYECRFSLPRYDTLFFERHGEAFIGAVRKTMQEDGLFEEEAFERSVEEWKAELPAPDEKLTVAFGFPLTLSSFHEAAMEPDDLMEDAYASGQGKASLGFPLAITAYEQGADISILLVTRQGKFFDYVWSRESLKAQFRDVASLEGAANLVYLTKAAGMVVDTASDERARSLCEASSAFAGEEGWRFTGVEEKQNCRPSRYRNISVARNGEIKSEEGRAPFRLTESDIICYD